MLVITTPSGTNGHQVLEKLAGTDEALRVVALHPSHLDPELRKRVDVVQGSLDNLDVVNMAFDGADGVFFVVPPNIQTSNVKQHYLTFAQVAAEAIKARGVRRLVWISTLGRDINRAAGHYVGALAADEPLEATGVPARILRPAVYMDNLLWQLKPIQSKGVFALATDADTPHFTVATRDIAKTAATLLLDHRWSGQESIPLIGDRISPNEMAEVVSEVLQRPIRYRQLTAEEYKANMISTGASEAWAQGLADMAVAENKGFYESEPDTSARTATNFRQWCEAVLKPAFNARMLAGSHAS